MKYQLKCVRCGALIEREPAYLCPACGGILDVQYPGNAQPPEPDAKRKGVFRYAAWLPVEGDEIPSLGEGSTPMVRSVRLGKAHGVKNLFFKLESANPSASFKDRGIAVGLACAKRFGVEKVIIASSGNASASAAAYAARSEIPMVAMVPEKTPANKVAQAVLHGAKIMRVRGKYSDAYALCRQMAEKYGWFNLSTTFINPYAREGYKTIGYEIYEDLGKVPDWIVCPTGAGPILAAIYKAFAELGKGIPKLVCVQAANCGPIAQAFVNGAEKVQACEHPKDTLASGINDSLNGYSQDGDCTLDCVRKSVGTAVLLDEDEILESVYLLGSEGIDAEPAAAVGAKAVDKLCQAGTIGKNESVVVVVTGHGLKNQMGAEKGISSPVVSDETEALSVLKGE